MRRIAVGYLAFAAACGSGSNVATPTPRDTTGAVLVRTRIDSEVFVRSAARVTPRTNVDLNSFHFDVPAFDEGGECAVNPVPRGVGRIVSLYHPTRRDAKSVESLTLDTTGRMIRFVHRRGRVSFGGRAPTRAQLDSLIEEARRANRSSVVTLEYMTGQAYLSNDGGGQKDEMILVPLASVAHDERFGAPDDRAHSMLARCAKAGPPPPISSPAGGVSAGSGMASVPHVCVARETPFFEFQVEEQARYVSGDSVSPRPYADVVSSHRIVSATSLVQFVVDTTGVAMPSTLKFLQVSDPGIVDATRAVLPRWRFTPARVGGCLVRQLVQIPVGR